MDDRYALIIGLDYKDSNNINAILAGCINDAFNVKNLLINNLGFKDSNIRMLTDDTPDKGTKENILKMFDWLVELSNNGIKNLWLSYAGHGIQRFDTNNDENDNMDECIIPLDYFTNRSIIRDDEMVSRLIKRLNPKANLISVFDCCHSGTILDLPYRYYNSNLVENSSIINKDLAKVIMFSGCKDSEKSEELFNNINGNFEITGAMTSGFINILKNNNYSIKCIDLYNYLNNYTKSNNFNQRPQISTTFKIDNSTNFILNKNNRFFFIEPEPEPVREPVREHVSEPEPNKLNQYKTLYFIKDVSTTEVIKDLINLSKWYINPNNNDSPYKNPDKYLYIRFKSNILNNEFNIDLINLLKWYNNPDNYISPFSNIMIKI